MYFNRSSKTSLFLSTLYLQTGDRGQIISRYRLRLISTLVRSHRVMIQAVKSGLSNVQLRTLSGIISITCQHSESINKCRKVGGG